MLITKYCRHLNYIGGGHDVGTMSKIESIEHFCMQHRRVTMGSFCKFLSGGPLENQHR